MQKMLKVLVVDDDDVLRNTYADVFKQAGWDVREAKDGLEGLDSANTETPDVIFSGIIMPKMDGFGMMEALARNVNTSKVPVVIFSHMGREEDRQKAQSLGARDFFVQGMITPFEIVKKIKALFGSGEYDLRFNINELDAPKLAEEIGINATFKCSRCLESMVIQLKDFNSQNGEFSAKLVCPKCR